MKLNQVAVTFYMPDGGAVTYRGTVETAKINVPQRKWTETEDPDPLSTLEVVLTLDQTARIEKKL